MFILDNKFAIFFGVLIVYWTAAIIYMVSKKMHERDIRKSNVYPKFLEKRTSSLMRSGKKIKNSELIPWYSEELDSRMNKLRQIKKMHENALVSEEKATYREALQQYSKETVRWCKKLKNEYHSILYRKDKKHLDAQINFANTILANF